MEPMIEGLVEVASPPQSAGKRGRIVNRDWPAIVQHLRAKPWHWYVATDEPAANLPRLRDRYPDIVFEGHNNHLCQTTSASPMRQVCDVYVRGEG